MRTSSSIRVCGQRVATFAAAWLTMLVSAPAAAAQATFSAGSFAPVALRAEVRVTTDRGVLSGRFEGVQRDSLRLNIQAIALSSIRVADVRHRPYVRNGIAGAISMGLVGALVPYVITRGFCDSAREFCREDEREALAVGGAIGAVSGAAVGVYIANRRPVWRRVRP